MIQFSESDVDSVNALKKSFREIPISTLEVIFERLIRITCSWTAYHTLQCLLGIFSRIIRL